jgi:PAS domain S-box-containing protein
MPAFSGWLGKSPSKAQAPGRRANRIVRALRPGISGIAVAVAIGLAAAGLIFGFILPLNVANRSAMAWVEHTQEVITAVDQIALSIDDIETGQRGFLLTQDAVYLEPYNQAVKSIWQQYFRVRDLTTDNPDQQQNLQNLAELLRNKLSELEQTVALAHDGNIAGAQDIVREGAGQRLMDQIRQTIGAITAREKRLLQVRRDRAQQLDQRLTLVFVGLSILGGVSCVLGVVFMVRTLTDRGIKTHVAAVAERQRLLDMANEAIVMMREVDGTIEFWSEGCHRLYGYTAEQAIGRSAHELLRTVFPVSLAEVNAMLLRHGAWNGELRHRTRDGVEVVVSASKTLHDYADGRLVVETLTDVTALRQAQIELQRREMQAAAERQRLLDMVNVAAVMMREVDGTIQFWSEGCRRLYDYTAEQAVGRSAQELLRTVFPVSLAEIDATLLRHGAWNGELRHHTQDGVEVIVSASKTLHDYADGRGRLVVETLTDVTALRHAQTELQKSEAQFKALVGTAADGFVIARADGQIQSVNQAMLNMFGYDRAEELIGQNLRMLMPAAEGTRHDSYIAAHRAGAPARVIGVPGRELLAVRRDGSAFPIDLSVSSFGADDTLYLTGIIRDATSRQEAERALRVSEARHRDLLLTLGLGTFMARDLDGTIQYWAEGCERLYGWTAEEAVGQSAHELLGTIFPVPLSEIEATLEREGEWKGDLRHRTRDGRELTVTAHKRLRRGLNGGHGVVMEALTDVTAYRRAESALRESEARLRLAQQVGGVAYTDRLISESTMLISPEFVRLYGLPSDQTHMSVDALLARIHPEDQARLVAERASFLERGGTLTTECRICRMDGAVRWVTMRYETFPGIHGQPVHVIGAQQDITETVAAREDKNRARLS